VAGTGFTFGPPEPGSLVHAVENAVQLWQGKPHVWNRLVQNGMTKDLSWNCSAEQYEQLFEWAFIDPPIRQS
jgi:starch synthase